MTLEYDLPLPSPRSWNYKIENELLTANSPERRKRLQIAGAFCVFDKKLRSRGTSSILWGTVRDPKVILISAGTLAVLALWNLALIVLAAIGKTGLALWKQNSLLGNCPGRSSARYVEDLQPVQSSARRVGPLTVEQVRDTWKSSKKAKPKGSVHMIEFDVNTATYRRRNAIGSCQSRINSWRRSIS